MIKQLKDNVSYSVFVFVYLKKYQRIIVPSWERGD